MQDVLRSVWEALNTQLFELGGRPVSLLTVIMVILIMATAVFLSRLTRRAIKRAYAMKGLSEESSVGVVSYIVHIAFLLVGFGVSIETIGINLSALFAAGAVFAVAIGLAIQGVIQNFVSGVLLFGERTIKPGDVIEVEGQPVKVQEISMRATIVRTLNDESLIVPNGNLVQAVVKNYTRGDSYFRLRTQVGVVYSSDMNQVQQVLEETASALSWRVKSRKPVVLMLDFGDNSVNFEVSVWINDPWRMRRLRSDLNRSIWWAFKENDIVIAFPQLDVHFDPPVSNGLVRLASSGEHT